MEEKIVSKLDDLAIEDEDNENIAEAFLKELHNKVRQFEEILNIEHEIDQRLIYFSFERKKIKI